MTSPRIVIDQSLKLWFIKVITKGEVLTEMLEIEKQKTIPEDLLEFSHHIFLHWKSMKRSPLILRSF